MKTHNQLDRKTERALEDLVIKHCKQVIDEDGRTRAQWADGFDDESFASHAEIFLHTHITKSNVAGARLHMVGKLNLPRLPRPKPLLQIDKKDFAWDPRVPPLEEKVARLEALVANLTPKQLADYIEHVQRHDDA